MVPSFHGAPQNDLKEKYIGIDNVIPCITHAQESVDVKDLCIFSIVDVVSEV